MVGMWIGIGAGVVLVIVMLVAWERRRITQWNVVSQREVQRAIQAVRQGASDPETARVVNNRLAYYGVDDVNAKDGDGRTPLHLAAIDDRKEDVELLLAYGANTDAKDKDGLTPLHLAVIVAHTEIVELFLAAGADVNAQRGGSGPFGGATALYWLAAHGVAQRGRTTETKEVEMAELLLAHGADINAIDNLGNTPLAGAMRTGRQHMVDLLRRYGGKEFPRADIYVRPRLHDWLKGSSGTGPLG